MWTLNMLRSKPTTMTSKDIATSQPEQQMSRKKRSSTEEDCKNIQKRAALTDVTNKPEQMGSGRVTRAKKPESQSLVCNEPSLAHPGRAASPIRSPNDRMSIDGDDQTLSPDGASVRSEWDLLPHNDIDATDENDPQLCAIYVNEIYEYLRENEARHQARDYMRFQKEITPNMRTILVDWLVEVAQEYKLSSETLYLAVSYMDRYLSRKSIIRHQLQLLGVACMMLASKYEEIFAPSADDFVYISDNTYAKDELFTMEANVLDVLEFSLTVATIKNFLRRFLKAAYADQTVNMFANYLCELALHDYGFVKYLPSLVAASAVYLALRTITSSSQPWSTTLEFYTRHKLSDPDMQACIIELYNLHKTTPRAHTQAVDEKYATGQYLRVSSHKTVPPISSPL